MPDARPRSTCHHNGTGYVWKGSVPGVLATLSVTVSTIRCTCGRCGGGGMVYGSAYPYGETCPVCGGKGHDEITCVAYEVQSA
jgi:DnaJ-class molecular chaperone